jgi:uracil-DNA glycosylase
MYDEIGRTVYPGVSYQRYTDLVHWAHQGVLLLNTALSVEAGKPDSHTELWAPWMRSLIPRISEALPDVIWVFVGGRAKAYMNVPKGPKNTKWGVIHPAAAAHRGGQWDCEDIFNRINQRLSDLGKAEITW